MDTDGPFAAVEGHDVHVFRTRAEAQGYLEAQDVEDGVYTFYDSGGNGLQLVTAPGRLIVTDVKLGHEPEQLLDALRYYVAGIPAGRRQLEDEAIGTAILSELLDELLRPPNNQRVGKSRGIGWHRMIRKWWAR